jgi:energy-coupling factor transporter ATP-binding protein EcfA2
MEIKEIDPVFQLATDFVNQTSQHIFLTGKAGTGKTTFLKHIRGITYKNCIVAAPTGVAAINAEGVTLHSLFQLPFEPYLPGTEYNNKNYFRISRQKLDMLRRLELLIIDEVSMLRADVLDSIDALLRRVRRNSKPFGGLQMLYIGDLFQLPPVVKEDEWAILSQHYASPFFFHAKAIRQAPPVYLELKKVYRQREQSFVELLNRVRNNAMTQDDLRILNRHYQPMFTAPEGKKYITLTTRNAKADAINNQKLASLTTPAHKFTGKIEGEFPEFSLPTDLQLTLKQGAQIMFIKNDLTDHRYFNGKIGTISRIRNSTIEVLPEGANDEIVLEQEQWKNIRYTLNQETGEIEEEELGAFTQYPIRLAWAITIHKSQGLTFDQAVIDTGDAFAPGQAYVALSRCTSLDGIVLLSRITPGSVQTDEQALNLAKSEKAENELQRILEEEKRSFWTERLLQYFDCSELIAIPRRVNKMLEDKLSEDYNPARALVQKMLQQAYDIQEVARKFQSQL